MSNPYWSQLEYRVTSELKVDAEGQQLGLWCDGFIPEVTTFDDSGGRIEGRSWIGRGGSSQESWSFTLWLPAQTKTDDAILWEGLLPAADKTNWVTVDVEGRHIEVRPDDAVAQDLWDQQEPMRRLIRLDGACHVLLEAAKEWSSGPKATVIPDGSILRVRDVVGAIDRVLAGEMTLGDVIEWADFLEMHEGVRYHPQREGDLADVLFRLATPEVNGEVTQAVLVDVRNFLTTKL